MLVLFYLSISLFLCLCALIIFFILIKESKSMGLGASFGGDVDGSLFGTSTADVLKKITAWLSVIFFVACIIMSYWSGAISNSKPSIPTTIEATEN